MGEASRRLMLRTPEGLSGPRQVSVLCQRRAWHRCPKTCLLDRGEYANFPPLPITLHAAQCTPAGILAVTCTQPDRTPPCRGRAFRSGMLIHSSCHQILTEPMCLGWSRAQRQTLETSEPHEPRHPLLPASGRLPLNLIGVSVYPGPWAMSDGQCQ